MINQLPIINVNSEDAISISTADIFAQSASQTIISSKNMQAGNTYGWTSTRTGSWGLAALPSGDVTFSGDIFLKGESLNERLTAIEKRLAILTPNIELEERWEELRDIHQQYLAVEKELLEKERIWKILQE